MIGRDSKAVIVSIILVAALAACQTTRPTEIVESVSPDQGYVAAVISDRLGVNAPIRASLGEMTLVELYTRATVKVRIGQSRGPVAWEVPAGTYAIESATVVRTRQRTDSQGSGPTSPSVTITESQEVTYHLPVADLDIIEVREGEAVYIGHLTFKRSILNRFSAGRVEISPDQTVNASMFESRYPNWDALSIRIMGDRQ